MCTGRSFQRVRWSQHISAGIIDHIILDCRDALRKIDRGGPFVTAMNSFAVELKNYVEAPPTTAVSHMKYFDDQYGKNIAIVRKKLAATQSTVEKATIQVQLDVLLAQRYSHASTSELGVANLLKKGAQEALEATELTLKSTTKFCGESEFAFNKAIELTGARYRKEHGGMSLSNQHSLLVAQHYLNVATAVEVTYGNEPALQEQVVAVMKTFRRLSRPAYKISLVLKSQDKVSDAVLEQLKDAVCEFAIAFREEHPTRKPYPKLHWLECIIVPYAELHGFIGQGSEEGFESAHNRLAWIKKLLFAIPFMKDRGLKMGQRYQISLIAEFDKIWQKLHPTPQARGPYKKKTAAEKESKQVERLETTVGVDAAQSLAPFGLTKLQSGNFIYEAWKERYEYVAYGAATEELKALLSGNQIFQDQHNPRLKDVINYV